MALHKETPLIESIPLGNRLGKKVYLKMESAHEAGSIKIRGIGALCEEYARQGAKRFICPSGGNGGYAAAWAGRKLGIKTTIIIPEGAPQEVVDNVASLGAEVLVKGRDWYASNDLALRMAEEEGARYITTYDDPILWRGHSTVIDEAAAQYGDGKPDGVLLSVGGGGILSGVLEGMDRNGWGDVPVVACGTYGACAFYASQKAGKLTRLPEVTSMVTCISAEIVTPHVMELAKTHKILSYLTSDYQAMCAVRSFLDDHRVMVDPSCGVTLSALYTNASQLTEMKNLLVIVCGGVGIKLNKLFQWEQQAKEKLPFDVLKD